MARKIKDYTEDAVEPIPFKHGGDTFFAVGSAPGGSIADLAAAVNATNDMEKMEAIFVFFDNVLMPESADLFAERLRDPSNPISLKAAMAIFTDLVEDYTSDESGDADRPTKPALSSQAGAKRTGQSSTAKRVSAGSTRRAQVSAKS